MMQLDQFFKSAWKRYIQLTPDAQKISDLLLAKGEEIVNDHVAFRTFNLPGISRFDLGKIFEQWGYRPVDNLHFPEKKLNATYYIHQNSKLPKIFISELLLEEFPNELQTWIKDISKEALSKNLSPEFFLESSWKPIAYEDYKRFYPLSEYAAWTAAFGIQVNHFTVFVNQLKSFQSLQDLNEFLVLKGFILNSAGGLVKGTPNELLEQSSTMAQFIPWQFVDGSEKIMGCYYEFARRYYIPGSNQFFHGFIPKSADKIFESTFDTSNRN